MQADKKIEAFAIDRTEQYLYYGTLSGQLVSMAVDDFSVRREVQAHAGTIIAIALHPKYDYLACLALDRTISIFSIKGLETAPLAFASIRNLAAENESVPYADVKTNAQAIAFHPKKLRVATRTASGSVAEFDFDARGAIELHRCARYHDQYDVVTLRYTARAPFHLLTGSGNGEIVLSSGGETVRRWKLEDESVHWFEHTHGSEYLVASDSRLLARLDIGRDGFAAVGAKFARDDFEHVVFNQASKKAFASSFDRTVYELDPHTCESLRTTYRAPFKCRWMHSLERDPDRLIVQVRDGSLIDISVRSGTAVQQLRTTPLALWTCLRPSPLTLQLYGEGRRTVRLSAAVPPLRTTVPTIAATEFDDKALPLDGFVKRAAYFAPSDTCIFGHSSGVLIFRSNKQVRQLDVHSAVRDLVVTESGLLYAATEGGAVVAISLDNLRIEGTHKSAREFPFWAIAVSDERREVVAFERHGLITILDSRTLHFIATISDGGRCKRAKCSGSDSVLFTWAGEIRRLDLKTRSVSLLVTHAGNTVEDFIWDQNHNYIVTIGYTNTVGLYDFNTGQKLDECYDQIDYSKGLEWISGSAQDGLYPLDFVTYGRSGAAHLFRIHNESIVALGTVR